MAQSRKYLYENVLITGIGGDIALGIAKILKQSAITKRLIGSDIHDNHPGKLYVDKTVLIKRADSEDYLDNLIELIDKYSIDLLIPMSEPEIRTLFKKNYRSEIHNIPIILANEKSLEIGLDKYKTYRFLRSLNLPHPWTIKVKQGLPKETPCIIKSREGSGSKDINIVYKDFINFYRENRPEDIWQEMLLPEDQEYTCGVYGLKNGEVRTIVYNRQLSDGYSVSGKVVINQKIESLLLEVAKNLELKGSINVQLRLTERGPIIFEINPRFSSTAVFRHKMGFKDVLWSLFEQKNIPLNDYESPREGLRFYRGSDELVF